jgi:hypothetical protein
MESADAPSERAGVRAYACGVHSVITATLSTGGAHVNAASGLVAEDPDDYVVGEAEPTALLSGLDAACIKIEATMVQPGIDFATSRASLNAPLMGNVVMTGAKSGVRSPLQQRQLRAAILDTTCTLSRACR